MSVAAGPEGAPRAAVHKGTWKKPEHNRGNRTCGRSCQGDACWLNCCPGYSSELVCLGFFLEPTDVM